MSNKLKGAFWPVSRKIACARLQRELGCDPRVPNYFPEDMVNMNIANEAVYIQEATPAEWRTLATKWRSDQSYDFREGSNIH